MKPVRHVLLAAGLLAVSGICVAAPASPYAGEETRQIKALSAEDISSYLAGRGMGLAKTAELNGYPGPLHVLELAEQLKLSPQQKARTQDVYAAMQAKAIEAGRALIDAEHKLDRLFAGRAATPALLDASLQEIGALQARVRGIHLEAHLLQIGILHPEQVALYNTLRGYGKTEGQAGSASGAASEHKHRHKH